MLATLNYLFADEVDWMVPSQSDHGQRRTLVQRGKGRSFQSGNVSVHAVGGVRAFDASEH